MFIVSISVLLADVTISVSDFSHLYCPGIIKNVVCPKSTEFILLVASERSYDDTNGEFLKQNVKGKVGKSVSTTVYGYNRLQAYYFAGLVNMKAHRKHPH